jgi:low affinity Fe/Cu permease
MDRRHSAVEHFKQAREDAVQRNDLSARFGRWAAATAHWCGSPLAFFLACSSVVLWAVLGPLFGFSDTWQLVINTATTVITFLIVFLIQNTQNRDARALHLKLDELIRALHPAKNEMIDIESLSDTELEHLQKRYEVLRTEHLRRQGKQGGKKRTPAA